MMHYFESGFSVRQPAWHGLAKVRETYPGREEAIIDAGQNWLVQEGEVFKDIGAGYRQIDGWKTLERDDTGAVLSIVKDSYTPVQNSVMWDIAEALLKDKNLKYETAGVLKGGLIVWVLVRVDEPRLVFGDRSAMMPFLYISSGHEPGIALQAAPTAVRIVCWNTISLAWEHTKKDGRGYTFKHTVNVMERIEEARVAIKGARSAFAEFTELADELSRMPVDNDAVNEFLYRFLPPAPADVATKRINENIERSRTEVRGILMGPTCEGIEHSAWGLFNAGIEYLDHVRAFRNPETYFSRTMEASPVKARLVKLVKEVAG